MNDNSRIGRAIVIHGRNADVDSGTEDIAAAVRGTLPAIAAGYVASIVSGSANDAAAGTGARTVVIRGIGPGTAYNEIEEVVTLNGTNAVETVLLFTRINEVRVLTAGSGATNAGILTTSLNSQAQDTVPVGYCVSSGLFFAVPTGHHLLIDRFIPTMGEVATTEVIRYQIQGRKYSPVTASAPFQVLAEGDLFWSPMPVVFEGRLVIPAQHEVKVVAITGASNKIVSGTLVGTLVPGPAPLSMFRP